VVLKAPRHLAPTMICPFYSDVLERIALQFTDTVLPAAVQSCLEQYSRMLIMIGLKEPSLTAMHAGTRLAMSAMVPLDDLMLNADDGDDNESKDSVFQQLKCASSAPPWSSSQVGVGASEWLEAITPQVPAATQPSVDWVNQLFQPQTTGFDDGLYEVRTVARGSVRFAELRNKITKCADELSDSALLGGPGTSRELSEEKIQMQDTQTRDFKSAKDWARRTRGKISDQDSFRQLLQKSFEEQLALLGNRTPAAVLQFEHCIPAQCADHQGRLWSFSWQERTCLADHGAFVHTARRLHTWHPNCPRAKQLFDHFASILSTQTGPENDLDGGSPIVVSIDQEDVELAHSVAVRDELHELLDVFFDFDDYSWKDLDLDGEVQIIA